MSQGRSAGSAMAMVLTALACAAPVSTMRSPYHLRVVEVRNDSDQLRTLKIEPAQNQHLGSATTFTGTLRPGEVKVLYLYHGFDYDFRILDPGGFHEVTRTTVTVDRDMGLLFAADSLTTGTRLVARIGEPTVTFADSLQESDPFGLRGTRVIEPDTSRGHHPSNEGIHVGKRGNPEERGTP